MNHCSLSNPFKAFVANRVLYDMDATKKGSTECLVFGVSSYEGHYPTFQILLGNGAVFSYVPPHLVFTKKESEGLFSLDALVYHKCKSNEISYASFAVLREAKAYAFLTSARWKIAAEYIGTVDWIRGNELLHILLLETGQVALLPNHKVLFGSSGGLPDYKKLHATWK